ncbi:patatin-like phospholipase family protein [Catalinimonas alkaloidigena]|uniref:patatin-like phospholipase family protein n=1 Tax=Catalinimonas alkaloidigena TaxID=1075417 RepID=UPI0024055926|nr:patatin-like phospholipase family protein [Catalinimonas alkaloidigena]
MKIGLVLSGGGARGIAHLGIIKALLEFEVPVDIISGSSSGAIAGALFSYGYSVDEILKIISELSLVKLLKPAISKTGLLRMDSAVELFRKYLPEDDFSTLNIPLFVCATDLCKGKSIYFSEGQLLKPLIASSCLPVIFDPINIDGNLYIDGGVLNNFPTQPLLAKNVKIIGLHSNPVDESFKLTNVKTMFERTFLLAINANSYHNVSDCDLFLEPPGLKKIKVFDIKKSKEIFEIGYKYGKSKEPEIKNLLHS